MLAVERAEVLRLRDEASIDQSVLQRVLEQGFLAIEVKTLGQAAGIANYVAPEHLAAAVRTVARGEALLAPAVISCAGDDETPKSLYSEPCSATSDCADNLECFPQGICSQSCGTTQECQLNLGVSTSVCVGV